MNIIPNLIHPVDTTIERLTREVMVMDTQARQPVHGPRGDSVSVVVLPSQPKWSAKDEVQQDDPGTLEKSDGYILVRVYDMDRIMGVGQRLKHGDRITTIGDNSNLDLYIVSEEPCVHRGGTNQMVKYHFEDRRPTSLPPED